MEDSNEKVFAVLAYFGILWLVPLLAGKTQFSRFHANQGLVLFIVEAILGVITGIFAVIPFAGWIIAGILGGITGLVFLVCAIFGIVNAVNGETKPIPGIGNITIIK